MEDLDSLEAENGVIEDNTEEANDAEAVGEDNENQDSCDTILVVSNVDESNETIADKDLKEFNDKNHNKPESKVKKKVKRSRKKIDWITGKIDQLDPEADVISYEESVKRLTTGAMILAFFMTLIATVLTVLYTDLVVAPKRIMVKAVPQVPERKDPIMPQVLKVMKNGQVQKIEFDHRSGSIKETLMLQLPKTPYRYYFAANSDSSMIHFIRDDLLVDVIEYHPYSNWHRTIAKSKVEDGVFNAEDTNGWESHKVWQFTNSVQINGKLWLFGKDSRIQTGSGVSMANSINGFWAIEPRTKLWYSKKGGWSNGPLLPIILRIQELQSTCSVALNRSSVLFISANRDPIMGEYLQFFSYNFDFNQWYAGYDIHVLGTAAGVLVHCSSTIFINKQYGKSIILAANFHSHIDDLVYTSWLQSDFDSGFNIWKILATSDTSRKTSANDEIISFKGMVLSLHNYKCMLADDLGTFYFKDWTQGTISKVQSNIDNCTETNDFGPIHQFLVYYA